MPLLTNPNEYLIENSLNRASVFLTERRNRVEQETSQTPGIGEVFDAQARAGNVIGSFVTNRVSRIMAGVDPFNGDPDGFERDFDPGPTLQDDNFYLRNPWAVQAYDELAGSRSQAEFDTVLELQRVAAEDHRTIAEGGTATALLTGLAVNIADPTNFLPLGTLAKTARGVGSLKLVSNVGKTSAVAGTSNLIQEELLHATNPGRPIDRLDADLAALGIGAAFGATLGFMTAPNFRIAPDAIGVPTRRINDVDKAIKTAFDTTDPDTGTAPRNIVDALEDGEQALRRMLDEEPRDDASVAVLFSAPDLTGKRPTDTNAGLVRELQAKYDKAGRRLEITRHPLQDDYDAFDPLEATLNDAAQRLRAIERDNTQSAPAGSAELAESVADTVAQEGASLFAKALSTFTPSRVFDKNMLDLVQLGRRVFFYDGTVSKRTALDPTNARGVVPAEALKDLYSVHLAEAMQGIRGQYSPARDLGLILGRNAEGAVELQTGKKIAAALQRDPITWTTAAGEQVTIPPVARGAEFNRQVVAALREQKAAADGFIDLRLQELPPQMQRAAESIRGFYDTFLDLGDQAGLLPGQRTLAEARTKLEASVEDLNKVLDERPPSSGDVEIGPGNVDPEPGTVEVFSGVPEQWRGVSLFDWGSKGLRTDGNRFIEVPGKRARKSFDRAWLRDLTRLDTGEPQVVRHLRQITDEIWPVNERRGKFWSTTHYLVPKQALERARLRAAQAAESRFEKQLLAAEERVAKHQQRVDELQVFADRADHYFTRRFLAENVRNNKAGFTAWLKRSWLKARNIGIDPETGKTIRVDDLDRPLIPEVRERLGIGEQYRSEGDLFAAARDPDGDATLAARYEQAVGEYFDDVADSTYQKITSPENRHGIETAYAGGSPFKRRVLTLDESDTAAKEFLDNDPERILNSYFHTVGGRIATVTALKRARGMFGKAGDSLETPEDFIDLLQNRFQDLRRIAGDLDREAGTNLTPRVQRHATAALQRFERRIGQLQGQGLIDGTAGANALFEWGGRQLLGLNYLALLGSQTLSAINDVAALTLFADVTSIPRNVGYMVKAIAPLKQAPLRDLKLMRLAYEGEHARVLALGDVDFDDVGAGVGFGATRTITNRIGTATDAAQRAFNEINLINSWNRFAKKAAAMISMDRLVTHSRRLIEAQELIAGGMDQAKAIRQVGLSRRDAARLAEYGINEPTARRMLDLIRRYGTDEDGKALADLTDEQWTGYKGLALPDARRWLEAEGDSARELFDIYNIAINTEVERAMVITPGLTDKPLINDQWWGRSLNQFQSFLFAMSNQIVRPMAQRPAGRQVATLLSYFAVGAIVDAARNQLSGRRNIDETARLWKATPLGMTYSVVHTTGLSGWLNRPLAFADKIGVGPGAALGNTTISRSAFQGRTFWGSLSPVADLIDRTQYGALGAFSPDGFQVQHAHALRKAVPFQNLLWFRLMTRLTGQDPLITETLLRRKFGEAEPKP